MLNMMWLYRRPILDYWAENEDSLGAIVTHVLVDEFGCHFGLSEDSMEAIEGVGTQIPKKWVPVGQDRAQAKRIGGTHRAHRNFDLQPKTMVCGIHCRAGNTP